jgi:hypothetical protein
MGESDREAIGPQAEQISNLSQFVRPSSSDLDDSLALNGMVSFVQEPSAPQSRLDVDEAGRELLVKLLDHVEKTRESVEGLKEAVQSRGTYAALEGHAPRGPYRKDYGRGMRGILIEDVNDVFAKWVKLPRFSRPSLMHYLVGQLGIPDYTIRRRLRLHHLRLEDLPWSQAA